MSTKLYVGNLPWTTSEEDLSELFSHAGQVQSVQIIRDRDTQRSRGFAFVEMADSAEALRAINLYNGHVLNDRSLVVNEARPQTNSSGGRGGYNRGGGRYGGGRSGGRGSRSKGRGRRRY